MMDSNSKQFQSSNQDNDIQIFLQNSQGTQQDLYFDTIVGTLQDIVLQPQFTTIQQNFMKNNCLIFTSNQQNKIQYTTIFQNYEQTIQKYIMQKLEQQIDNFNMDKFCELLKSRYEQIDEELLEIIQSFIDFQVFKNMMVEYKEYVDKEKLGVYDGLFVKGLGKN